jgi:TonB family protein
MKLGLLIIAVFTLSSAAAIGQDGTAQRPHYRISAPVVVKEVKPTYTEEALRARIQGSVLVSAVVLSDGTVGSVQVVRSLDTKYGLDQQAVDAAKQWVFKPGTKDGEPVAVQVSLELKFTLKSSK